MPSWYALGVTVLSDLSSACSPLKRIWMALFVGHFRSAGKCYVVSSNESVSVGARSDRDGAVWRAS